MVTKKNLLFILLGIFIVAQFIRIDKSNPPIETKKDFLTFEAVDNKVSTLFKSACYDCHSNETKYPWYSDVAPISFLLKSHVKGGRHQLNFSTWTDYSENKRRHHLEEMIEVLEQKRMPMKSYVFLHSEAKLSNENRDFLISWIQSKIN